jgi:hypothetical protein
MWPQIARRSRPSWSLPDHSSMWRLHYQFEVAKRFAPAEHPGCDRRAGLRPATGPDRRRADGHPPRRGADPPGAGRLAAAPPCRSPCSPAAASSLRSVRRTSRPNGLRPRGRGRRQGSGEPDGWTRHQRRWRYVTLSADATTSGSATRTSRRTCSCTTGSPGRSTSAMRDRQARVGDLAGTGEVGDVPAGVYGSGLGSSEHRLAYLVPRRTLEGAGIPRARSAPFPQHEASDGRRLEIRRATVASRVDIRHRRLQRTTGHATPGTLPPHANALSPHGVREANILFSARQRE